MVPPPPPPLALKGGGGAIFQIFEGQKKKMCLLPPPPPQIFQNYTLHLISCHYVVYACHTLHCYYVAILFFSLSPSSLSSYPLCLSLSSFLLLIMCIMYLCIRAYPLQALLYQVSGPLPCNTGSLKVIQSLGKFRKLGG